MRWFLFLFLFLFLVVNIVLAMAVIAFDDSVATATASHKFSVIHCSVFAVTREEGQFYMQSMPGFIQSISVSRI
jgi:hypothetical protein